MVYAYALIAAIGTASLLGYAAKYAAAPAQAQPVLLNKPTDIRTMCLANATVSSPTTAAFPASCQYDVSLRLPHSTKMRHETNFVLTGFWHG